MPMVVNALGKSSFGVWAAAASLTWMASALDFGIGSALITEVARAQAINDRDELRRLLKGALWAGAAIALGEVAGAYLLIPHFAPSDVADAYLIAAACMALNVPVSFAAALWTGSHRVYMVWIWEAVQSVLTAVGMWLLTQLTTDVRFYVALSAGGVFAINCASLAHFLISHPDLRLTDTRPSLAVVRRLLSRGAPYLILGVANVLAAYSDSVITLSVLGADAAAVMAISQRLCVTAVGLLGVLSQPLWPLFVNAAVLGKVAWIKRNIWFSGLLVVAAAVSGSAFIILFGARLIDIWLGGQILVAPEILWAIGIWIVIPAMGRIPDLLLNALGVVWFQVKVALVFGALAFAMKVGLANGWGVSGIVAAGGIAYLFTHLPAYLWWVARWIRNSKSA
jgi:O-antigen/teichoic acid export membrane protein